MTITGTRLPAFEQLDLFSGAGAGPPVFENASIGWAPVDPSRLDDASLIVAIERASQAEAPGLAREAARRGLADAVPALETLCRRFSGFGLDREVTEQVAALSGLASLGGAAAREAVTRLIVSGSVRGPGSRVALEAASGLGCRLPPDRVAAFLRDDDPRVREAACRCARGEAGTIAALIELLTDLHPTVTHAAAIALGRLGRREATARLSWLLRTAPSAEIVEAVAGIAGEDEWVRLGQTAAMHPDLAEAVLRALEESEEPRAAAVADWVRRKLAR
jgi:HEAT repeat protein